MILKAAAIDIGTNSTRLLIVEKQKDKLITLKKSLKITRLGEGVDESLLLKADAVKRVIKALKSFKEELKKYEVEKLKIVGTSALRDVNNSKMLVEQMSKKLDMKLEIISGEREAELNYKGAADSLQNNFLLLDIGGGSTEFIWRSDDKKSENDVIFKSLDIGCVRMTERFIKNPAAVLEYKQAELIKKFTYNLLNEIKFSFPSDLKVKGVGGTITTLGAIKLSLDEYDPEKIENMILKYTDLVEIFRKLKSKTLEEKKKIKGLQSERADIITSGVIILVTILDFLNVSQISISDRDILYGLIYEQLN